MAKSKQADSAATVEVSQATSPQPNQWELLGRARQAEAERLAAVEAARAAQAQPTPAPSPPSPAQRRKLLAQLRAERQAQEDRERAARARLSAAEKAVKEHEYGKLLEEVRVSRAELQKVSQERAFSAPPAAVEQLMTPKIALLRKQVEVELQRLCAQQTGILTGAIRGVDVHPLDARISQLRAALPEVNKLCWLDEPALAVAEMWRRLFTPIEVDHETP
jgi:hypothetical protein